MKINRSEREDLAQHRRYLRRRVASKTNEDLALSYEVAVRTPRTMMSPEHRAYAAMLINEMGRRIMDGVEVSI